MHAVQIFYLYWWDRNVIVYSGNALQPPPANQLQWNPSTDPYLVYQARPISAYIREMRERVWQMLLVFIVLL